MQVAKQVVHMTSDSQDLTDVTELVGTETPHAFLINYQAQGYAKFIIDDMTLNALETGLHKIKDSLTRK